MLKFLIVLATSIFPISKAAFAQDIRQASFGDWGVYQTSDIHECWIATTPIQSSTIQGGLDANDVRTGIYLMATIRADTKWVFEFSYSYGGSFHPDAEITLDAPLAKIRFFSQDGWAWPNDVALDRQLRGALEHADLLSQTFILTAASAEIETTDLFSASGFSSAISYAAMLCVGD